MSLPDVSEGDPHVVAHNTERQAINSLQTDISSLQETTSTLQDDSSATKADVANLTDSTASLGEKIKIPQYIPKESYAGPASTDNPTMTAGVAWDAAFNEVYITNAGALPPIWPVDCWGDMSIDSNTWSAKTNVNALATVATYRFMADGPEILVFTYAAGFVMDIFIDGRPYNANPFTPVATSGYAPFGVQKMVFGSDKPEGRLIEIRMIGGLVSVSTKKPYRIWKPAPDPNPKVAVVGDSFVFPTVMSDTASGAASEAWSNGAYQRMPALLGITSMTSDGIGGTGYIAPSGSNLPYTHPNRLAWLNRLKPDVIVMHGGGANDLYTGNSVADTITAATNHFKALRAQHPNAKLVFVEGFAPPLFMPSTFNPNYKAIREGVQTNLAAEGVGAYFLDIATTRPPFNGTGYVTAPNGSGNSDIYIGSDGVHPTVKGNKYIRGIVAPKLRRVLADQGELVGKLIL